VNRISITEFAGTIPDVYAVIYRLNPLSIGRINSERAGSFPGSCLRRDLSFGLQENMIKTITKGRNGFRAFIG